MLIPVAIVIISVIFGFCGLFIAIVGIGNIIASKVTQKWLDEEE